MDLLKACSKYLLTVYCLLSAICLLSGMACAGDEIDLGASTHSTEAIKIPEMVANVNGVSITGKELEQRMAQSRAMNPERFDAMGPEERKKAIGRTIDSMIFREIAYQEAKKRGIVVTDAEVEAGLENMKRQFPSEGAIEKTFAGANITIASWKDEMRKSLMAMKLEEMLAEQLEISDSVISEYYEKNKDDLNKDAIKVSHILVETEEEAKKVIAEFEKEKDFEGIAKRYSIDTLTKAKGGDLGWFVRGELFKEIEDAAYSLSPGQISGPVKSQSGYHIIRLDEKKTGSEQTLEDHKGHIRSALQEVKWQQMRPVWLNRLRDSAMVWKWTPPGE